jgi:hypothetical protein
MINQFLAISTLFAFSACSTPFEAQDGHEVTPTSSDADIGETEVNLENADVSAMALPEVSADFEFADEIEANSNALLNVLPNVAMNAMNVKRVENELQMRIFPQSEVYVKVCLEGTTTQCFAGKSNSIQDGLGSEVLVEITSNDNFERFTVSFSDGSASYKDMGPYNMPVRENIWEETVDCRAKLHLDYVEYNLANVNGRDLVRLDMSSDTPSSVMVCGLDDADENICVWDEYRTGRREIALPVDYQSVYPAVIRDEKGCSQYVEVTP